MKCDEAKPSCQKCVKTGRTCDGYDSPFRHVTGPPLPAKAPGKATKSYFKLDTTSKAPSEADAEEVDLLNRYFSTKTLFNVPLDCNDEARQVLEASATDPHVRHALASLRALRGDLETSGDVYVSIEQTTPKNDRALEQYCTSLAGVASNLAAPSPTPYHVRSTLLCCQLFISIEQVRGHFAVMAQHIIAGLEILRENRPRPFLTVSKQLVRVNQGAVPLLDVFVIKLFAVPCKFADASAAAKGNTLQPRDGNHRVISPDVRAGLTKTAASTLQFLEDVAGVQSAEEAVTLLVRRAALLQSLEEWLSNLEKIHPREDPRLELLSVSFMRLFQLALGIILSGTLVDSDDADIRAKGEQLQSRAAVIDERVKLYHMNIR